MISIIRYKVKGNEDNYEVFSSSVDFLCDNYYS